ncbi:hypothetical protein BKA57DRAFT_312458 [Linnemannia elongata]|nr:hypothetical protein BKA57DRAFT_312458 [Linnemannia elongata]
MLLLLLLSVLLFFAHGLGGWNFEKKQHTRPPFSLCSVISSLIHTSHLFLSLTISSSFSHCRKNNTTNKHAKTVNMKICTSISIVFSCPFIHIGLPPSIVDSFYPTRLQRWMQRRIPTMPHR